MENFLQRLKRWFLRERLLLPFTYVSINYTNITKYYALVHCLDLDTNKIKTIKIEKCVMNERDFRELQKAYIHNIIRKAGKSYIPKQYEHLI